MGAWGCVRQGGGVQWYGTSTVRPGVSGTVPVARVTNKLLLIITSRLPTAVPKFRDSNVSHSSSRHLLLCAPAFYRPASVAVKAPAFTEVQEPQLCNSFSALRPRVSPHFFFSGFAAPFADVHGIVLVAHPAECLLVFGVLDGVQGVVVLFIFALRGEVRIRFLIHLPLLMQGIVYQGHGDLFLEFTGALFCFPSPQEVLLKEVDVDEDPADYADEDTVLCVSGNT